MRHLFLAFFICGTLMASAQADKTFSSGEGELAFDGYDLTTYRTGGEPKKGNENNTYWFEGRIFQFTSQENLNAFKANPEKYLPAYGGWCATAMAQGFTAAPNYKMFEIQDGKLLFFEVKAFFNGRTQWQKDPEKNTDKAKANYEKLLKK